MTNTPRTAFVYQPPQQDLVLIYDDDDIVVIDKPAGLLSVPGRLPQHKDSCYTRILDFYPHARVSHRLDMATSGLLMFAKHRAAEVALSKMFQAKSIQKRYVALVQGQLRGEGRIDAPMTTDWPNRPKQKIDFLTGKSAQTRYQVLQYLREQQLTRVELTPITGRSHQLRLHMAYLGHPISGDRLYHPQPDQSPIQRLALHACHLSLKHPLQHFTLALEALPPF